MLGSSGAGARGRWESLGRGGFKFIDDYGVRDFGCPDARVRYDAGFSRERYCNNRIDEDEDGLLDCEDPDCAGDMFCFHGEPRCTLPPEEINPVCRNDPDSPCEANRVCINLSDPSAMNPVARCMYPCENEEDCNGFPCSDAHCVSLPGAPGSKVCVAEIVSEGEIGNLAAEVPTLCAPDLVAHPGILFGLNDGEFSCVRPCSTGADCTQRAPICDVNTQPSQDPHAPAGVCVSQIRGAGAFCSETNGLNSCSINQAEHGMLVCYAPAMGISQGSQPEGWGACGQICGRNLEGIPENCSNRHLGSGTSTCTFGVVFDSQELGFCDDGCSAHPLSCEGPGWEPGERGQVCMQFLTQHGENDYERPDLTYCADRLQRELALWDPTAGASPGPDQDCTAKPFNCPLGAFCMRLQAGTGSACVLGCSITATVSGCAQSTTGTACRSLRDLSEEYPDLIPSHPTAVESGICTR